MKEEFKIDTKEEFPIPKEPTENDLELYQKYQVTFIFDNKVLCSKVFKFDYTLDEALKVLVELSEKHPILIDEKNKPCYVEKTTSCLTSELVTYSFDEAQQHSFKKRLILKPEDLRSKTKDSNVWRKLFKDELTIVIALIDGEHVLFRDIENYAKTIDLFYKDFIKKVSEVYKIPLPIIEFIEKEKCKNPILEVKMNELQSAALEYSKINKV
ncbi:MAG: hypothetical protein CL760_12525 [Chloroflexi bacterium]|nr:hypothetical protein [Chloroflexota bacterium]|tara:strand:- start:18027 stop:18662 length:636 start_codon:yes stop_codon:yes gene_type:complete